MFTNFTPLTVTKESMERVLEAYGSALAVACARSTSDGSAAHMRVIPAKGIAAADLSTLRSHDYWEQAAGDLAAYATHARRNTIESSDVACLFERYAWTASRSAAA